MALNIAQICKMKYPEEVEKKNITFRQPENDILIETWNVDGVDRPLESELLKESDKYELAFFSKEFKDSTEHIIQRVLYEKAKSMGYNDCLSLISYAVSNNSDWLNEAKNYIKWRDSLYFYQINILNKIKNTGIIPFLEDFQDNLPEFPL